VTCARRTNSPHKKKKERRKEKKSQRHESPSKNEPTIRWSNSKGNLIGEPLEKERKKKPPERTGRRNAPAVRAKGVLENSKGGKLTRKKKKRGPIQGEIGDSKDPIPKKINTATRDRGTRF